MLLIFLLYCFNKQIQKDFSDLNDILDNVNHIIAGDEMHIETNQMEFYEMDEDLNNDNINELNLADGNGGNIREGNYNDRNINNAFVRERTVDETIINIETQLATQTLLTNESALTNETPLVNESISTNEIPLYTLHKPSTIYYNTTKLILQFLLVTVLIFIILFCLSLDFIHLYFVIFFLILSFGFYILNQFFKN